MATYLSGNSPRRLPPYIGITGVQSAQEVERLFELAGRFKVGPDFSHNLMVGALVSASTVVNAAPINTGKPYRHVSTREELRELLVAARDRGIVGMIHFELHKTWPGTRGDGDAVIALLKLLSQDNLSPAVQLNGVLLPEEILRIYDETGAQLVLQMRKEIAERGEEEILAYLDALRSGSPDSSGSAIAMMLMDPSAGEGHKIALGPALSVYQAMIRRFPNAFTVGFAGGLGGSSDDEREKTTRLVRELCTAMGTDLFSVDVETKVRRRPVPELEADVLDMELCEAYFSAVQQGVRG